MENNVILGFLHGRDIVFDPDAKTFLLSDEASASNAKPLDLNFTKTTALSRQFLQEIQINLRENKDDAIHLSQRIIRRLQDIDSPQTKETIEKIQQIQSEYKAQHSLLSSDSPDFLKNDTHFVAQSVQKDGLLIRFADISLRNNKKIARLAVNSNAQAYRYISLRLKSDESICLTAFSQNGVLIKFAPFEQKNNPEVALAAVISNPLSYAYLPEDLKTNEDFLLELLTHNFSLFSVLHESVIFDPKFQKKALDLLDIHEGFKKAILDYANPQLRTFLVSKVLDTAQHILNDEGKRVTKSSSLSDAFSLAEISPNLLKVSFQCWNPTTDNITELNQFLSKHKKALKHAPRRQILLILIKELDYGFLEQPLKIQLALGCMQSDISLDESLERASLMPLITKLMSDDQLALITDFSSAHLKHLIINELVLHKIVQEDQTEVFLQKMQSCRMPSALFIYAKGFFDDPVVLNSIKTFVSWICNEEFEDKRHETNSYKELLSAEQKTLWETKLIRNEDDKILIDSESWQDLFLSGTEVIGSCQRVDGDKEFNRCLLGYVLDGKIRILCVKDHEDGPILARCILKILKDNRDNPVLLIEKSYPIAHSFEYDMLKSLAKQKADSMGLELYEAIQTSDPGIDLTSDKTNFASFEYEDGSVGLGVTTGIYHVNAKKITDE